MFAATVWSKGQIAVPKRAIVRDETEAVLKPRPEAWIRSWGSCAPLGSPARPSQRCTAAAARRLRGERP